MLELECRFAGAPEMASERDGPGSPQIEAASAARRRKNANGEGAVAILRKDGRWVASLPLSGGKRKYYYASSGSEANGKVREALGRREEDR